MTFISNKQVDVKPDEQWEINFQKKYGWFNFFGSLAFLLAINLPAIIYIALLTDVDPISAEQQYETVVANLDGLLQAGTITVDQYNSSMGIVNEKIDSVKADFRTAWIICLSLGLFHLALYILIICIVYINRKSRKVKNRGKWFLYHLFISGFVGLILLFIFTALATGQLVVSHQRIGMFVILIATAFCFLNFLFALTNRMHLVYLAYKNSKNIKITRKKSKSAKGGWAYFKDLFDILKWNLLIQFILAGIGVITVAIAFAYDRLYNSYWAFSSYIIPNVVLYVWVGYYTWVCRSVGMEFSDFYLNSRYMLFIILLFIAVLIPGNVYPYLIRFTLFQLSAQLFLLSYVMDSFMSLVFYQFFRKDSKVNSVSIKPWNSHTNPSTPNVTESNYSTLKVGNEAPDIELVEI